MIEYAYEGCLHLYEVFSTKQVNKIENFYYSHLCDEDRLIAICENIIKNKGIFKL